MSVIQEREKKSSALAALEQSALLRRPSPRFAACQLGSRSVSLLGASLNVDHSFCPGIGR